MKTATKLAGFGSGRSAKRTDSLPLGGYVKRLFDVTGAITGLFFLSPIFILVAILVKMSDGGSIFYSHRRMGHGGTAFGCLKFRTMVMNGDEVLKAYLDANPHERSVWQEERKLQTDPRVTKVGATLRKLSLDELPQLINILRGEMSIVGPRPVVKDEIAMYGSAATHYFKSRPGLTGLWQVSGRNDACYVQRVEMDRRYVENWSLRTDVVIILKTIPAVCLSRGSY
jgi:exopolysaccharide production protein ExoY